MNIHDSFLDLGLIQTTVDYRTSWQDGTIPISRMNRYSRDMVMDEIKKGFQDFQKRPLPPRIVVIPEYSIPWSGLHEVENLSKDNSSVVIGGMDILTKSNHSANKGVIIIPNKWPQNTKSFSTEKCYWGKTYFSQFEIEFFRERGLEGTPEGINYIIDAGKYGNIGIAICSDFYDIERFVLYRGYIQHLIIICYNKDYRSFEYLSEAISRLLMCNVVICNTGYYGDSLVYTPSSKEHKRTIYRNAGPNLFASQVVRLPVSDLHDEQKLAHEYFNNGGDDDENKQFKWAPGYNKRTL